MRKRIEEVAAGLQIIAKYPNPDINAEHDVIYARCDGDMGHQDETALKEASWHISEYGGWEYFV